jgi:SAM-dependent methyltransferase
MLTQLSHLCICGGVATGQPFSEHFEVHVCSSCGTQQFHPRPDVAAPSFRYDEATDKYSDESYLHGRELRWSHHELLKRPWQGRRVLEIGCFNGFFVDELRRAGADAHGVDVNSTALAAGAHLFGLQGRLHASVDEAQTFGPFDDIVCIDVIEHVDTPDEFVAMVSGLLAPDGRLFVAGPTVERRFFDKSDYPPHHKWRFSRPGLVRLLERGGYTPASPVIQYDGLLMLRNWIGKCLHGSSRKEFYGDVAFAPPTMSHPAACAAYAAASRAGQVLFRALRIPYCSAIVSGQRIA